MASAISPPDPVVHRFGGVSVVSDRLVPGLPQAPRTPEVLRLEHGPVPVAERTCVHRWPGDFGLTLSRRGDGWCLASAEGRARMIAMTRRMQEVFERIETLPKTTLAEIGGPALGGGFELALSCDLRIVADGARVGLPEAALGLLPAGGGTQRMTRICGEATARRLILGAETIAGTEAVRLGLAQWSVPGEQLESFARATVARIAGLPPRALAECKACIDVSAKGGADGYEIELAGSGALLAMPETLARVARFLEGRRGA